ncbi:hypothetical protein ADK76_36945 [Streptomyces griseoflavus]|uniref:hypothetical protein n=1 Tax=Streptomyces rimosus TaxID=1927 RepID=UPI0004C8B02C|nr:hypothetical protein [Streptomyces rimosus]KOG51283.1 hypothetical protein ADK76_36945 [Streptomyces griseoflavus]
MRVASAWVTEALQARLAVEGDRADAERSAQHEDNLAQLGRAVGAVEPVGAYGVVALGRPGQQAEAGGRAAGQSGGRTVGWSGGQAAEPYAPSPWPVGAQPVGA